MIGSRSLDKVSGFVAGEGLAAVSRQPIASMSW